MAGAVPNFDVKLDTRAFDRAFAEYLKFNKRAIPEIANTKVYFVARNAVNTTLAASKDEVRQDLLKASATAPGAPLAAVLVQKARANKGKTKGSRKGLSGVKMAEAIERFIKQRQNTVNFLRAGWIAAIKAVEPFIPKKGGAPKYKKVKTKGVLKGGGKTAKENPFWKATAEIWNSVQGGMKPSPKVQALLMQGLNQAIALEVTSMEQYIQKKLGEGIQQFNRS
jgi:hypothetical protein